MAASASPRSSRAPLRTMASSTRDSGSSSSASGEPVWHYALARMTAVRARVRIDGEEVWTVEGYWNHPRSPDDPYVEAVEGKYAEAEPK